METKFKFAKDIVYEAGAFIMAHLYDDLDISQKTDPTDLVTQMDRQIQDDLVARILSRYPEDFILAEENGLRHDITDGHVWVIDPIDGTTNFITQKNDFAIMLAYFEDGVGQFGLIYDVTRNLLYHGGGRFDVCCNNQQLPVFQEKPLQDYLIASNASMLRQNAWGLADLSQACLGVRVYGSAGISFGKVLSGSLLAYFSYNWPWDYAAAFVMAEKLGYRVLTMDGRQPNFVSQEPIMMVPDSRLSDLQPYLEKGRL